VLLCAALAGCKRLEHKPSYETVYVLAKQTYLRDRVAAVSNRVAAVQNGEKLELIERGRRFLRVKTEKGQIGWIEEHAVVNPDVVAGFAELEQAHAKDPVVATAVLRDDGYLHLKPGRDTDRFYLLPEGDKLQMLLRASVPKLLGPQASSSASSYAAKPSVASAKKSAAKALSEAQAEKDKAAAAKKADPNRPPLPPPPPGPPANVAGVGPDADVDAAKADADQKDAAPTGQPAPPPTPPPAPPPMEDWWLVRDSQGKVGWLMSRRMDVDVPDEVAQYAEGQKIVAAYLLRKVADPDSNFPDKLAPEYVTVVNPYNDGLPYDFNQVRVFTWNIRKHRYETAFRQRNLQGYLPVTVENQTLDNAGPVPTFSFKQGVGDSVSIDPDTGAARPAATETLTYRLDGEQVHRVLPGAPAAAKAPQARPTTPPPTSSKPEKRTPRTKRRHRR
jgi:SH3-like domain-containing protein